MTWSVYQHWASLKVCVVRHSYLTEFYSWIFTLHIRDLFKRIEIKTEEKSMQDYFPERQK
jgi:hypothetical protein